jgi:phosphoglycerate dehydrogenase-like enzyme
VKLLVLASADQDCAPILDVLPPGVAAHAGTAADLVPHAADADAIVSFFAGADELRPVFLAAPRLRWLHVMSAGVEYVLFDELARSTVATTNARGAYSRPLAEFAIAGALHFAKRIDDLRDLQARRSWDDEFMVGELHGQTMGIAGYGDIGRACARLARAFGMRVVAQRRRPELSVGDDLVDRTLGPDDLVELAGLADVLVIAAPLTPETRGMISAEVIAALRPHAVVVNVGRGAVVDEDALAVALADGRIRGAALDVFATEPLPSTSPLWALDNVVISPHAADRTADMYGDAIQGLVVNIERFLRGEPLANPFDASLGY